MSPTPVRRLLEGIGTDLRFMRSHTLQPGWYKILKVFLLLGFLLGYWSLFGPTRTAAFLAVFLLLSLIVHLVYRTKTKTWTRPWLDFVVHEEGNTAPRRIGVFYYFAVALNAAFAVLVSQLLE